MPGKPRRAPHFSPPICHISPPTDPSFVIFTGIVYILIKNGIATKIRQNEAVFGQVPHFGPFPFKKAAKGVPKRVEQVQDPPNPVFSIPIDSSSQKKYSFCVLRCKEALG
jgi:hypothetical protein